MNDDEKEKYLKRKEEDDRKLVECVRAGHIAQEKKMGNCYYEYYCPICDLRWRHDSSD